MIAMVRYPAGTKSRKSILEDIDINGRVNTIYEFLTGRFVVCLPACMHAGLGPRACWDVAPGDLVCGALSVLAGQRRDVMVPRPWLFSVCVEISARFTDFNVFEDLSCANALC